MPNTQKKRLAQLLSETEDESRPHRYVRTFGEVERPKAVSEIDEDELQNFINLILGARGPDTAIPKLTSS